MARLIERAPARQILPAQWIEQRRIRAQPTDERVPIHLDNHPCVIVGPPELSGHPSMPPSCLSSNVDGVWRQRPSFHALALNSFRSFFHPSIRFPIDDGAVQNRNASERAATAVVMTNSQPSRSHRWLPRSDSFSLCSEPRSRRARTGAANHTDATPKCHWCWIGKKTRRPAVRVQSRRANLMPSKRTGSGGARFVVGIRMTFSLDRARR